MFRRPGLDDEAHPPSAHHGRRIRTRRSSSARRLALPIVAAVLFAMVAIPLLSLGLVGDADVHGGPRSLEQSPLAELHGLPRPEGDVESQLRSLKEWLKSHFSEEEVAEIRDRFIGDRDPQEVRAEVARLAESVSRGEFLDVPRYFTDRVKDRLGKERVRDLERHFFRVEPTPRDLEVLAVEELFPDR